VGRCAAADPSDQSRALAKHGRYRGVVQKPAAVLEQSGYLPGSVLNRKIRGDVVDAKLLRAPRLESHMQT